MWAMKQRAREEAVATIQGTDDPKGRGWVTVD